MDQNDRVHSTFHFGMVGPSGCQQYKVQNNYEYSAQRPAPIAHLWYHHTHHSILLQTRMSKQKEYPLPDPHPVLSYIEPTLLLKGQTLYLGTAVARSFEFAGIISRSINFYTSTTVVL